MHVAKVEKGLRDTRLELYDHDLGVIESESFADLSTMNFHLQTLVSKHRIEEALVVIDNKQSGKVELFLAKGENSFFIS